jgi:hypothetical protein
MRLPTFPTPEDAVLAAFPGTPCIVVAQAVGDDAAYAVVDVGQPGHPYLYEVSVEREEGGWVEGSSGNGPGWTLTDRERDLGTATVWGEAPAGTTRVRGSYMGDIREAPVPRGVYLLAWWRVPSPSDNVYPRVDAFQIGGKWVPRSAVRF